MKSFVPPNRLLLGPGPSNVAPRVLEAQARPAIGHLDPAFSGMMEEVKVLLRHAFRTGNAFTFPISAPASLAMEASIVNLLEPGDTAIIAQNGVFGGRMADIVRRAGGNCVKVETEWGRTIDLDTLAAAIRANPGAKLVGFVHAETSTGARSDAAAIAAMARAAGMLVVMDTVTGLAGVPVEVDAWGIDVAYSGTQKCLSVPPGLAPITFSPRAVEVIKARKVPVQSWFCDLNLVMGYWTGDGARSYHHTAPVNALYGLHEGLLMLAEEGLEASHARHAAAHAHLAQGVAALGLDFLVDAEWRLPQLNTLRIPEGADDAGLRRAMLLTHGIEIGAGLGALAGKVWRIGLMGENARTAALDRLLAALAQELATQRSIAAE